MYQLGWVVVIFCAPVIAKSLQVQTTAPYIVLMNSDSGAILYEKQAHVPCFPASTTKIATALFVLAEKKTPLDFTTPVSYESLRTRPLNKNYEIPPYWWDTDGTRVGLKAGENVSIEDLLHGVLLASGNDASNVLAEGVSGSIPAFVEELNQYLQRIGCVNTRFLNPHGCHHPNHVTTAYDLCLMTKEALKIPKFRAIVSSVSYLKPKTNKQGPIEFIQTNQLMKPGKFYYPKAIGVKTGFHSAAQNSLVAAAQDKDRTLIAAILGNVNREDRYLDAIRLFEAAFAETKKTQQFFGTGHLFIRRIPQAKIPLKAVLMQDLQLSYYPSEAPTCRAFVCWDVVPLPIQKGQSVGEVRLLDDKGSILCKSGLFAKEEVRRDFFYTIKTFFRRLLTFL